MISPTPDLALPAADGFALGVYLHFPFCRSKCGYCDFASVAATDLPHAAYAEAVRRELAGRAGPYRGWPLRSLYLGGGTPSLWDPTEVARVVGAVRGELPAAGEVEVTIEINPATASLATLEGLRRAGIGRLSVGVQSLDDEVLRLLGRRHTAGEARWLVAAARRVGFDNLSCDLIFGTPGQTLAAHLDDLRRLLDLAPSHVSTYALSLAADAPLRRAGFAPAPDELLLEMMEASRELLERAGLPQYEVSNYAPLPRRSRHNALVWDGHPYLGLGASAHSMLPAGGVTLRAANPPVERYLGEPLRVEGPWPVVAGATVERVSEPASRLEALFLGLRTVSGLDRQGYRRRFAADPEAHFGPALAELAGLGLLQLGAERIAPTRRGIWLADELALRLMEDGLTRTLAPAQ